MKKESHIQIGPKNVTEFNGKKKLGFKLDDEWYNVYEDVGTCTPQNQKSVKVYPQELAVTRAFARAIRTGLAVDYCSKEELT